MDIHFLYCHQIYGHSRCRHQPIGMDNVCVGGGGRGGRVFTFLFYVTGINTYKLYHHFKECPERSTLDLRFELSFQMIINEINGSISNP